MLVCIPDVLSGELLAQCRTALQQAQWQDGRATAGSQAVRVKANQQLDPADPLAVRLGEVIGQALAQSPTFIASALPLKVLPPRFNRYAGGGHYGEHIDSALYSLPGGERLRADLSATLFFSDPEEYEGGELVIRERYSEQRLRLPAGHLVLYSAGSLHRVEPVTRGARLAAFFWIQSLVRDEQQRSLLLELDETIQALTLETPNSPQLVRLTGLYHNLLRGWSQT